MIVGIFHSSRLQYLIHPLIRYASIHIKKGVIMKMDIITKADLQEFKLEMLNEIRDMLQGSTNAQNRSWLRSDYSEQSTPHSEA
jgi:hypothetical protein